MSQTPSRIHKSSWFRSILTPPKSKPSPLETSPNPKLPLELLLKIVDEHWPTLMSGTGPHAHGIMALSHTCHALRMHCLPLLFHTACIYSGTEVPSRVEWPCTMTSASSFARLLANGSEGVLHLQCLRVIQLKHDHPSSGHFRINEMLDLLQREFY